MAFSQTLLGCGFPTVPRFSILANQNNITETNVGIALAPTTFWTTAVLNSNAACVAAAQTVAAGGNFVLSAGANFSQVATIQGRTGCIQFLDNGANIAKGLIFTAGINAAATTFTINGFDLYQQPVSEQVSIAANANSGLSQKTYSAIFSISSSAATGIDISVGTTLLIGLPYYLQDISNAWIQYGNVTSTNTLLPGVTTTATATTGDVRGTILIGLYGANTMLSGLIALQGGLLNPAAQVTSQFLGVPQFANVF